MASSGSKSRKSRVNGTREERPSSTAASIPLAEPVAVQDAIDLSPEATEPATDESVPALYVPTLVEIESELWSIATGEGSESSRVSALRALADIMGLTKPSPPPDFPEGMNALLDALAEGLGNNASS